MNIVWISALAANGVFRFMNAEQPQGGGILIDSGMLLTGLAVLLAVFIINGIILYNISGKIKKSEKTAVSDTGMRDNNTGNISEDNTALSAIGAADNDSELIVAVITAAIAEYINEGKSQSTSKPVGFRVVSFKKIR